jgi:hypothetical protein
MARGRRRPPATRPRHLYRTGPQIPRSPILVSDFTGSGQGRQDTSADREAREPPSACVPLSSKERPASQPAGRRREEGEGCAVARRHRPWCHCRRLSRGEFAAPPRSSPVAEFPKRPTLCSCRAGSSRGRARVLGSLRRHVIPLCFSPDKQVFCPTHSRTFVVEGFNKTDKAISETVSGRDIWVDEIIGLVAAGLASTFALRGIRGTSTPYSP